MPHQSYTKMGVAMALAFAIVDLGGQVYPHWLDNSLCFKYIGCNAGFFGYDALLHMLFGSTALFFIYWITDKNSILILPPNGISRTLVLLSLVTLGGVIWEIVEFAHDVILESGFFSTFIFPPHMAQPSNADTMGDLIFNMFGACGSLVYIRLRSSIAKHFNVQTKHENEATFASSGEG